MKAVGSKRTSFIRVSYSSFQGHGVKGHGHTAMNVEILWTGDLVNRWINVNPRLAHTNVYYGYETNYHVFKVMESKVKVICLRLRKCYNGGCRDLEDVTSMLSCLERKRSYAYFDTYKKRQTVVRTWTVSFSFGLQFLLFWYLRSSPEPQELSLLNNKW